MGFGTGFAVFFIIWWLMLFVVLPFGHRSQDDEQDVTLGTVSSAPAAFSLWKVVLRTTIVSAIVFGAYVAATVYGGYSVQDVMALFPDFK
jgi:predicted secreted protein